MRAAGSSALRLRDVIEQLKSEGWVVRQHHVAYAMRQHAIALPKKQGGWFVYTQRHVEGLRRYLAERSRSQPREVGR